MKSWGRQRKYALLLAEDAETRRLLGVVMCCLLAAEALLPPPFPSAAPLRSASFTLSSLTSSFTIHRASLCVTFQG